MTDLPRLLFKFRFGYGKCVIINNRSALQVNFKVVCKKSEQEFYSN